MHITSSPHELVSHTTTLLCYTNIHLASNYSICTANPFHFLIREDSSYLSVVVSARTTFFTLFFGWLFCLSWLLYGTTLVFWSIKKLIQRPAVRYLIISMYTVPLIAHNVDLLLVRERWCFSRDKYSLLVLLLLFDFSLVYNSGGIHKMPHRG